jgi:hypothetical protein
VESFVSIIINAEAAGDDGDDDSFGDSSFRTNDDVVFRRQGGTALEEFPDRVK